MRLDRFVRLDVHLTQGRERGLAGCDWRQEELKGLLFISIMELWPLPLGDFLPGALGLGQPRCFASLGGDSLSSSKEPFSF